MCHTAPDGCHCTCAGMSSCTVFDILPFDAIILRCKEEANKGGSGAGGSGRSGGLGELITLEELYVAQVERGSDGVGPAGAVSPGLSKKKKEIQARSAIAWSRGEPLLANESMYWWMQTGRGRNLPGE